MEQELAKLLREALTKMGEHVQDRLEGEDVFQMGCGCCEAGTPTPHSWACQAETLLRKAGVR